MKQRHMAKFELIDGLEQSDSDDAIVCKVLGCGCGVIFVNRVCKVITLGDFFGDGGHREVGNVEKSESGLVREKPQRGR